MNSFFGSLVVITLAGCRATNCPDNFLAFHGSCYLFGDTKLSFYEAEHYCNQHGAHLVHVNSAIEDDFLKEHLRRLKPFDVWWMGLTDEVAEGHYVWTDDNTPAQYTGWHPGQPDGGGEDCVVFSTSWDFQWGDYGCTHTEGFICETESGEEVFG
ncbi:asialoglycoprotein receptor 1-like [Mya arenaria]|uniref:asialoglycoprotein receptor 1-like n=1 Tax=Mya arenaria TaxID=6604 RepID=UPI0022E369F6|nr:asialoglycoprotein receptor 1-like [Mya arenaria]